MPRLPGPKQDLLTADPLDDLVGTSADRLGLEFDMPPAVLERGIGLPGALVDMPGDHRKVDVPDVGGQRLAVEKHDRSIIIGMDAPELVGPAANGRYRNPFIHDHPIAEGHIMGGDRPAVAPAEIVADHHLVEHAVHARLPRGNRLRGSERLHPAVEGKQSEAGQAEHVTLGRGADEDRIGAVQVDGQMPVDSGRLIGLAVSGEATKAREDRGIGLRRVVPQGQGFGRRGRRQFLGQVCGQIGKGVADRAIDPLGVAIKLLQGGWVEGDSRFRLGGQLGGFRRIGLGR